LDIGLIAILLGLLVGGVMANTGAGGAVLSIPLIMFFLKQDLNYAAPLALLAVFAGALISSVIGLSKGIVRYKAALLLALTGMLVAPMGVALAHQLSPVFLRLIFIGVLFYIAFYVLVKSKVQKNPESLLPSFREAACEINPATSKLFWTAACTRRLVLTGGVAGFLSGLLGVGGGFIVVPSLAKISNLNYLSVVATSLAMITLVSLVSIISYANYQAIDYKIALPFVSATLAGSVLARQYTNRISAPIGQIIFGWLTMIIAILMMLDFVIAS
jgi:uncharacterized membrane protein YfcA